MGSPILWLGGASTTGQVDTLTVGGTIEVGDEFNVIMTAEDGSTTVTVNTVATTTVIETTRDEILADVQASTNALFTAVAFAGSSTDAITVTADTPGTPFYCTVTTTESGGGAADAQTFVRASTTANSGPADFNTAANWEGGVKPAGTDTPTFARGDYPLFYGLDQSAVDFAKVLVGGEYTGQIGDPVNNYYLRVGTVPTVIINSRGAGVWIKGTSVTAGYVTGGRLGPNTAQVGGTIGTLYIIGPAVSGTVTVADSADLTTLYALGASGVKINIGENVTSLALIEANGGAITAESACTTVNVSGSARLVHQDGAIGTANVRGGRIEYNSGGTLGALNVFDGVVSFTENRNSTVTVTDFTLYNGTIDAQSGLANVAWTNPGTVHGGKFLPDTTDAIQP